MEPLDQQELRQEAICTLGLVSNPSALTHKIGYTKPQKLPFKLLLITLLLSNQILAKKISYTYTGYHNNYPIDITYVFEESSDLSHISAIIETEKITEKNTTILNKNKLYKMTQSTKNDIDGEHFFWTIEKNKSNYNILFSKPEYNESFSASISEDRKPMTIQGLVYTLRHQKIVVGDVVKANLIMPWKTILPIRFIIQEKTTLNLHDQTIPAYKISLEIDLILGQFLPKSSLWVTQKKPHLLLKQTGLNKEYTISKASLI